MKYTYRILSVAVLWYTIILVLYSIATFNRLVDKKKHDYLVHYLIGKETHFFSSSYTVSDQYIQCFVKWGTEMFFYVRKGYSVALKFTKIIITVP